MFSHQATETLEIYWPKTDQAARTIDQGAGAAAERLIFGSHCEGASEDYHQADGVIERFARLSPDSQYFPSPVNPTQESANIMSICRLRTECQVRADEFLIGNRTQLLSITEKLRDHECVDC